MRRRKNVQQAEPTQERAKKKVSAGKILLIIICVGVGLCCLGCAWAVSVNAYVKSSVKDSILTPEEAGLFEDADCILVLGGGLKPDGTPNFMLMDRLTQSIELYEAGAAPKLLMSGDHGHKGYDEVNAMKTQALDSGVPAEDIFTDHAGFSTYESMYRARDVFLAKRVIIVTQRYHLYRAIYIAQHLGLDAVGVPSDPRRYAFETKNNTREFLARNKDFIYCIIKPKPTYLGETIPVWENGNLSAG